jgi:ribonucleoside-diphosphate reductase alpha chain
MNERRRLPDTRNSITHRFEIAGVKGYITVGLYENGEPGEIFVKMAKEGATLSGLMDSFALSISLALQYGVPLRVFVDKFSNMRFEPSGYTGNPKIPYAKSIMDYIARWLVVKFLEDPQASIPPDSGPPCSTCGESQTSDGEKWICRSCAKTEP